ncbi:hypothetical protein P9112_003614 [Eukaryota sp. TZLM1-RC]
MFSVLRFFFTSRENVCKYFQENPEIFKITDDIKKIWCKCRKSEHNIATCPLIQKEKLNARAASADLNFSLSHNPENEFLIEISDNISDKEDQTNDKKCVFCRKLVVVNDSGRPLLFCDSCVAADQLRCPIRVPALLSPLASIPFAVVLRAFTENLRKGLWDRYEDIGLPLNIFKCLIIGHESIDFFINDVNVPFINYDQSGFRFVGCYLGNIEEVKGQLSTLLTQFGNELESIENLNIEKHLKFFFLKICYSRKFTHILRSTSPSIFLDFCRIFDKQRANFLAKLLEIDASQLQSHIFCGTNFGGIDFHKSSYLCKAAFIGGGKNFIYEFVNRFPEKIHLIENCDSSYLISLQQEIETLSPNIWFKCFPSDIVKLPPRSLLSLPLTFAKLQNKILKLGKRKNPVFTNFLFDLDESCSSCLISQIPNIYDLLLNDHQWTTAIRIRCFLWPCSLPNDLICRCKSVLTLSHILNCKYFITYRSIVHDSVRDQLYAMCESFNIDAFIEPLVRKLSSDQTDDSFGERRADLVAPGIDGVLNVVDVVSVDVCKNSAARLVNSADSPLSNAEKKRR